MVSRTAAQIFGEFVAGHSWGEVTPALRHEARRSILNAVGCAIGVAQDPAVQAALRVMQPFSGAAACTTWGQREKLDPMAASFVNTIAANLLDYDDTHLATVVHPTAPVAPAVMALAEQRGLSGAAVLHAFLLGAEVECRIGLAVSPGHYARGWHITSTCGVFGAAAGCARLLGLDAVRTAHALGIAASQSAGLVENLPSAAKNVGMGNASRNGLLAALLAEAGYEAAPASIEGPLGWARAMGDVPDMAALLDGLGARWEIARNTYKPYPAGIVFHAVIDACMDLRAQLGVAPDAIARVVVAGDALLLARGDRVVRNNRDARVSIHHSAALGFVRNSAGVRDFEQDAVEDAALAAFRAKVVAQLDESLPRGAARVTATLADGHSAALLVTDPRGSETRPMSDAELEAKYHANAELGGMAAAAAGQIEALWALEDAPTLQPLMARLQRQ